MLWRERSLQGMSPSSSIRKNCLDAIFWRGRKVSRVADESGGDKNEEWLQECFTFSSAGAKATFLPIYKLHLPVNKKKTYI
jgi:hypothetical protein